MRSTLLCATLLAGLCCSCSRHRNMGAAEGDHDVLTGGPVVGATLADLPPAVRATLKKRVPQGEVADIDRQLKEGHMIYRISFIDPTKNQTVNISEDGKIIPTSNDRQRLENRK